MDQKTITDKVSRSSFLKRISLTFLLLLILIPVHIYYTPLTSYVTSFQKPPPKKNSPYISIESIPLTEKQTKDIERLGLTPKPQVKIVTNEKGERIIHGRFLHITDIHPDPYYKEGSSFDEACHAGKGTSGKYGDAILGCDCPMILMDDTIAWIKENLKDKIDFVVWTGDNVRHDNDRNYPRTEANIFDMNQHVSNLMYEVFKKENATTGPGLDVDLVPSLGNNDVFPHNLFSPGPTLQTRELYRIWQKFIPPEQLHTFNRGAYFFQEVIPNKLAVLSINTLYLFQSNPLVDNCDKQKEPGYKLFEWLGYTLKEMRARNMKVWLSGHVPPNEKNFDISCLRKYIVWTHEYRDVIIGGLYGHMNLDHFIPLDSVAAYKSIDKAKKDKKKKKKKGKSKGKGKKKSKKNSIEEFETKFIDESCCDSDYDSDFDDYTAPLEETNFYRVFDERFDKDFFRVQGGTPNGKVKYMETLRETLYAGIKGKRNSGYLSERYSVAHVSASVIPTFNPGIRVWEYNITNLAEELASVKFAPWDEFFVGLEEMLESFDKYDTQPDEEQEKDSFFDVFAKKKRDKTLPLPMPDDKSLGPGYLKQTFTPERYVQYFADLEKINSGKKDFGYEIEYSTNDQLYGMDSLIVDEWIKYGRKLGKPIKDANKEELTVQRKKKSSKSSKNSKKKNGKEKVDYEKLDKIWKEYLKNTFVSSDYEHKGYG